MAETETIYRAGREVHDLAGVRAGDTFRASEAPGVNVAAELASGRIAVEREADQASERVPAQETAAVVAEADTKAASAPVAKPGRGRKPAAA